MFPGINKSSPHIPSNESSQPNATSSGTEQVNINRMKNGDVEAASCSNNSAAISPNTNRRARFSTLDRLCKIPKAYRNALLCLTTLVTAIGLTYYLAKLRFEREHAHEECHFHNMDTTMSPVDPHSPY